MKKCPYCAEQIKDEAILCRYCGSDLIQKEKHSKSTFKPVLPLLAGFGIASLVLLFEIATNPYTNLGNLIFHFIANAVIWTVVIGAIVWAWRYQVGRIILIGIIGIAIVVYLVMNSGDVAIPAILIPTQNKTNTPSQRTTPTRTLVEATDTQKPKTTVVSTIIPLGFPDKIDLQESEHWKAMEATYAGKTLVPAYEVPDWMKAGTAKVYTRINAGEIDGSYVGESLDIIGRISAIHPTEGYAQVILLSGSESKFQLRGYYTIFENIEIGTCIMIFGEVQQDETSFYVVIDENYFYEWYEDACR